MAQDYSALAADILAAVGGKENIYSLRHCVTRLRFKLKDEKKAQTDKIKAMKGVATVVQSAGEYMVVIGEQVHDVFVAVCAAMGFTNVSEKNEVIVSEKKKNILSKALEVITAAMGPTLNIMCACGLLKGILVILTLLGLSTESGIYLLLNAAGDAFFYFMPLLLGYNVARKLGIDPVFGFILAAALCYPTIQGVDLTLFGYTVNATYTSTFLPAVFGLVAAAPIYKFFDKHIPGVVKGFAVPLLTLVIAFPLTFVVIGPLANLIGVGINYALTAIVAVSPALAGLLLGGFWQLMVLFGVHGIPMMFAFIDLMAGNPSTILPLSCGASFAVCGAVLAVYLRSKNRETKGVALPAFISAIFGVTEPSVYGILLPNINLFVFVSIGAAVSGLICGWSGTTMYTYAGMGIVGILGLIAPDGSTNFLAIALMIILPFVIAFVLSILFYKDKEVETVPTPAAAPVSAPVAPKAPIDPAAVKSRTRIGAPVQGVAKPLSACSDEAFSGEALGKGCVVLPENGELVAPCDAEVRKLFPTGHAIGLVTADGVEILIHIGIDTVRLNGKYFTAHVRQGDHVTKGQKLISFDKDAIEREGYKTETVMVVTNTDDYLDVVDLAEGSVSENTDLLAVLA